MKESTPHTSDDLDAGWEASEGLDAGWDAVNSGSSSISPKASQRVVNSSADDLDGGWDVDAAHAPHAAAPDTLAAPKLQLSLSRLPTKANPAPAPAAAPAAAAASPVARQLTKKERREIERQQRVHAAKKQVELKQKRKQQRREATAHTQAPLATAVAESRALRGAPAAAKTHKTKRRPKPARAVVSSNQRGLNAPQTAPSAVARRHAEIERKPSTVTSGSSAASKPGSLGRRAMILSTLGVVLAVVALLLLLQKK